MEVLRIAAIAARNEEGWLLRCFSPESEVPFCGHATIAQRTRNREVLPRSVPLRDGPS